MEAEFAAALADPSINLILVNVTSGPFILTQVYAEQRFPTFSAGTKRKSPFLQFPHLAISTSLIGLLGPIQDANYGQPYPDHRAYARQPANAHFRL